MCATKLQFVEVEPETLDSTEWKVRKGTLIQELVPFRQQQLNCAQPQHFKTLTSGFLQANGDEDQRYVIHTGPGAASAMGEDLDIALPKVGKSKHMWLFPVVSCSHHLH